MKQSTSTIAYIFPGQGSQSVGMLGELAKEHSLIKNLFDKASVILNHDLWEIVVDGPAEKLNQTIHTQPAIFIASYALYQIHVSKFAIHPMLMAGHSLGEYTALACSRALSVE